MNRIARFGMTAVAAVAIMQCACTPSNAGKADNAQPQQSAQAQPQQLAAAQPEDASFDMTPYLVERTQEEMKADPYDGLTPFDDVQVQPISKYVLINFKTDKGDFDVHVYPEIAPNGAQRFVQLASLGFYDNTPIFRVVEGFVVQFGLNWRSEFSPWHDKQFKDDPSLYRLSEGTLAFAKAGPDTNSTQVFIDYADNSPLREQGGFTTFGRVVNGYEVTKTFPSVGDPSMGLDQGILSSPQGESYLKSLSPEMMPAMILSATVAKAEPKAAK